MKITRIEAVWLHVPIPPERQHVSDFGRVDAFDTTLVRMETDAGLVGHGEAKAAVGSSGSSRALVELINGELAEIVLGQDPRDPARLWELMYNGSRAHYATNHARTFPVLGRRGLTVSGMSGIDLAAWDILGQALGVPVWRLLGGRVHETLPAYASGGWAGPDGIGEELGRYVERGFDAVKMRIGIMDERVERSVARVRAAREALGPRVDIMVDAHGTMSVPEARRFCRGVESCDLAWFEEPVSADEMRGMSEIRAATDIPIAAGESLLTRFDFRDLIEARGVDVLQPDLAICGGLTEAKRIAALADAHQLRLAPHLWGGAIMFAAGLHLCIASPSAWIVEYSLGANPMLHDLAEESFQVVAGRIAAPGEPGLGITINDDFVREYRR